ncbi:sulfatase-like hydrolase/transferase [Isoptericola hypogeus]|uniref:Sulfatase-like hydrolase/transferase n=1 Tax=Isoptericola hypogeus TaxID=300179 RepID=A0ABN2J9G9_9MICO
MHEPNFVVVVTDDQGAWARGRLMPELITPTLDHLGRTGLELENFFCASPVCSPARASLLTGRMPSAHGVHDWIRSENSGVDTSGVRYLDGLTTTPEVLAAHGYACGYSGKWHLGDARTPAPGFDEWFAHRDGGGPYYGAPVVERGIERTEPGYVTDAITDHAVDALRRLSAGDAPFYLQVAYTAPHTPWTEDNHPAELLDLYEGCDFRSVPREGPHPWFTHDDPELSAAQSDPAPALRGYCAALTAVDRGVARLLDVLDEADVRASTYVVFTSDNGFSCGHHGYWGKGNGTRPLNVWDPSIRVPFVINRPGTIAPALDDTPTSAVSLHPTLLDLAGVPVPRDDLAAGESFAPRVLGTEPAPEAPAQVVVHDEYGGTRMIRTRTHKYVWRYDGPAELYDLVTDPGEQHNLADDPTHGGVRGTLHARLLDWFARRTTPDRDALMRAVTGWGQDAPVQRGLDDRRTYATSGPVPAARPEARP